jgi:hypothetical protein
VSEKQETTFTRKLVKLVPEHIYIEKTNNPYRRGVPDLYVEGFGWNFWVEMKWQSKPWRDRFVPKEQVCKSTSWPLQRLWLLRAAENGINAFVIVGVGAKNGYILLPPFNYENNELLTIQQLAAFIEKGGVHT